MVQLPRYIIAIFWFTVIIFAVQPDTYGHPDETRRMEKSSWAPTDIGTLIDLVRLDSLLHFVRVLSGETTTYINGGLRTIFSRNAYMSGNDLAADYIKQTLARCDLAVFDQFYGIAGRNVYGVQTGSLFRDQKYILCAHYDNMPYGSIAPGADDNASGTAAVLEAARILSSHSLPYTIIYGLWDEEEVDLLGSKYFAGQAAQKGDLIRGVVNLDMIAYDSDGDNRFNIHVRDIANSVYMSERMCDININYQIGLMPFIVMPGTNASDQYAFWINDYSAVLLMEDYRNDEGGRGDFNPYYHTVYDRIRFNEKEIFNGNYYEKCTRLGIGTVLSYVLDVAPAVPDLVTPLDGSSDVAVRKSFKWQTSNNANAYHLQIARGNEFSDLVVDLSGYPDTVFTSPRFDFYTDYFWRLQSSNLAGRSMWSEPQAFKTTGPRTQFINLSQGWNLISGYIAPSDSALASLFADIAPNLVLLKNNEGQVYRPDQSIDRIVNWRSDQGYWAYLAQNQVLTLTGYLINTAPAPMALKSGWNTIPYIRDSAMDTYTAWSSLSGHLVIAKNDLGKVYWPEFEINQIGSLEPGEGYQVYLEQSDTLVYPLNGIPSVHRPLADARTPMYYRLPEKGENCAILLVRGESLADGDEVAAWTSGRRLMGSGVVQDHRAVICIWDHDPEHIHGGPFAAEGETISFSLWSRAENKETFVTLQNVTNVLNGIEVAAPLAYSRNAVWEADLSPLPATFTLAQNYPNPFNSQTTITYDLPEPAYVLLQVFNISGRQVAVLVDGYQDAGLQTVKFDQPHLASGLYVYQIKAGKHSATRKMMLLR